MKLGVFSDLHLHNHKPFSEPTDYPGINTRAFKCLEILEQINAVVKEEKLAAALFCGDFWDFRGYLWVPLFNAAYDWVSSIADECPFILIPGNHDMSASGPESDSGVDAFDSIEGVHVIRVGSYYTINDKGERVIVQGVGAEDDFTTIPYVKGGTSTKRILLMHDILKGANLTPDFEAEDGLSVKVLKKLMKDKAIDKCFIGDIHLRQDAAPNIHYVGCCIQKSFSDAGQDKGMVIYDTKRNTVKFLNLESPQFLEGDESTEVDDYNYWQIQFSDPVEYAKRRAEFKGQPPNTKFLPPEKQAHEKRSSIDLSTGHAEAMREYVAQNQKGKAAQARLLKLGQSLLIGEEKG